jgi:hypothetical protein
LGIRVDRSGNRCGPLLHTAYSAELKTYNLQL